MSFIRTVLGDIAPEELGVCYAHEHLIIDPSFATDQNPDFLLDSVENGVAELKELKALGVGACVDSMPLNCGVTWKNWRRFHGEAVFILSRQPVCIWRSIMIQTIGAILIQ